MIKILLIMLAGMGTGLLLRRQKRLLRFLEVLILWSIFLLLFLLGLSIGLNGNILEKLPVLGWSALLIALGSICGSIVLARVLLGTGHTRVSNKT